MLTSARHIRADLKSPLNVLAEIKYVKSSNNNLIEECVYKTNIWMFVLIENNFTFLSICTCYISALLMVF